MEFFFLIVFWYFYRFGDLKGLKEKFLKIDNLCYLGMIFLIEMYFRLMEGYRGVVVISCLYYYF